MYSFYCKTHTPAQILIIYYNSWIIIIANILLLLLLLQTIIKFMSLVPAHHHISKSLWAHRKGLGHTMLTRSSGQFCALAHTLYLFCYLNPWTQHFSTTCHIIIWGLSCLLHSQLLPPLNLSFLCNTASRFHGNYMYINTHVAFDHLWLIAGVF